MMERVRVYLGFPDRTSLVLWSLTTATCVLLALIRAPLFSEAGMKSFSPPGEAFNLREVRPAFIAHLALIIVWCFLGVLQFLPRVRKSLSFAYHRAAGRVFLLVSVGVAISGLLMATRAFGGPFAGQVGLYALSLSFLIAAVNGYKAIRVKDIPAHRDWMIRLFAYGTSVITLRIFVPLGLLISPRLGLYTTKKCDVIAALIGNNLITLQKFPACGSATEINGDTVVVINGSFETQAHAAASISIGYEFGMLLALLIHASCAEAWIRIRYYKRREVEHEATQVLAEPGAASKSCISKIEATVAVDGGDYEQQQKSYVSASESDAKMISES